MTNDPLSLRRWQRRIFVTVWITYFSYYLCRYNMPMAKSRLCEEFGWTAEGMGVVFSALTLMYAVGQFVNGQLADRFGSRTIATIGALGSAAMNLAVFALVWVIPSGALPGHTVLLLVSVFWGANGFLQAMGWSPMVRVMTHWFPVEGRGKVMGFLGTCYQFGGAFAWLLAFFLTGYFAKEMGGDWRAVFWVPALLLALVGLFHWNRIRNRPEDVGLGPVVDDGDASDEGRVRGIGENMLATLRNPYLWVVAGSFFMLDVNRYGFVNWLPSFLEDARTVEPTGIMANFKEITKQAIHPLAGSVGAIVAGWATERFFGGRRAPVIAILLAALGALSIAFPFLPTDATGLVIAAVALIGFCTYGPHILMVGHAAQDFGKKSGAAGAAGFIDCLGYIGASLAGWGAGKLIDGIGYPVTFAIFGVAALVGAGFAVLIWTVRPDGSKEGRAAS